MVRFSNVSLVKWSNGQQVDKSQPFWSFRPTRGLALSKRDLAESQKGRGSFFRSLASGFGQGDEDGVKTNINIQTNTNANKDKYKDKYLVSGRKMKMKKRPKRQTPP